MSTLSSAPTHTATYSHTIYTHTHTRTHYILHTLMYSVYAIPHSHTTTRTQHIYSTHSAPTHKPLEAYTYRHVVVRPNLHTNVFNNMYYNPIFPHCFKHCQLLLSPISRGSWEGQELFESPSANHAHAHTPHHNPHTHIHKLS